MKKLRIDTKSSSVTTNGTANGKTNGTANGNNGTNGKVKVPSANTIADWTPRPASSAMAGTGVVSPLPGRSFKPHVSLLKHKRVALTIFFVIALAGIPIGWMLGKPGYQTEAVIRVSPRFLKNLNSDQELELQSNSQYREFVQQQVNTINRSDILEKALQKLGDKRWLFQKKAEPDRRAVTRLAGALSIKPVPDSYLVTISLAGDEAEGLADTVNAVVSSYLEQSKEEEFFGTDKRIANVSGEQNKLLSEMQTKFAERAVLAQELGVTTFSGSMLNPYDQALMKSKDAYESARRDRVMAESQLAALEQAQPETGKPAVEAMAQELAVKDNGLTSLKGTLYQRRSMLLTKLSGLAQEHPARKGMERELEEIEAEIKRATDVLSKSYRSMFLDQRRADVLRTRRIEKELAEQAEELSKKATWFAERYSAGLQLTDVIARLQTRLGSIDERIDFLSLESGAPGWVRMVSPAITPEFPNKGGRKKLIAVFILVALVLGAVTPTVIDLLDPRIHVAGQLQKLLGFPPVGWVLDRNTPQTRDFAQDQLLRLATTFARDHEAHGTRVVLFTATKTGEGTTTTVLDLAHALNSLGLRALAVEANSFTPDERYHKGVATEGFMGVLDDHAEPRTVLTPATDALPDRLCLGDATGRRPLGTLDELRAALTTLARNYDYVLLDAAPLLLSVDTELLVGLADATVLVVEAGGLSKGQVKRAVRLLERLAPPTFGAILTRVKVLEEGGFFANLLQEYQSGKRTPDNTLLSPWLWK